MVRLTVNSDMDAQILVLGSNLAVLYREVGHLSVELPQGLYKVKVERAGGTAEQLIELNVDHYMSLRVRDFPAIAPIGPILGERRIPVENLAKAAFAQPQPQSTRADFLGDFSEPGLLVLAHHVEADACCAFPLSDIRIMPWQRVSGAIRLDNPDRLVASIGAERWGARWLACKPGTYLLEFSDGPQTIRQCVPIALGWQTRVFLRRRKWLSTPEAGTSGRYEWIDVSVQMAKPDQDVVYSDHYETIEVARNALQTAQPIFVSAALIDSLLYGKFDNPIAGITGLHLYLEAIEKTKSRGQRSNHELDVDLSKSESPEDVSREVIFNLETLLSQRGPGEPLFSDITALKLRAGLPVADRQVVINEPPVFWSSWAVLRRNAGREAPIWIQRRLWNSIAFSTAWGPYFAWTPRRTSFENYVSGKTNRYESSVEAVPPALEDILPSATSEPDLKGGAIPERELFVPLAGADLALALGVPLSVAERPHQSGKRLGSV